MASFGIGLLIFLPFLTIIISIHELGHLWVARRFGMKVTEYFIGFGPRIWSTRRGELEWGVKGLPIGGYVKIAGMNPYETVAPEDEDRVYGAKPAWQRALTIFAGPGSHFIVAALMFAVFFMAYGDPRTPIPAVGTVEARLEGAESPAAAAGVLPGDVIVVAGDFADPTPEQLREVTTAAAREGAQVRLVVVREGERVEMMLTPVLSDVEGTEIGRIGIILDLRPTDIGPIASVVAGIEEVGYTIEQSFVQIGTIFGPEGVGRVASLVFTDAERTQQDAQSVVGISQQVGGVASSGRWADILYVFAYITVFIGLINLVPLPPFDGGHLAVLAIEKVSRRTIDMRRLIPVSAAVIVFFVVFVSATMFLDITKPIPIP